MDSLLPSHITNMIKIKSIKKFSRVGKTYSIHVDFSMQNGVDFFVKINALGAVFC
jgi:hypothetical protein